MRLDLERDGDGFWVADPNAGQVRHLDARGNVHRTLAVDGATAVLDLGGTVVVATRDGQVSWFEAGPEPILTASEDVDGAGMGSIADLAELDSGEVIALDTLGHEVHVFGAEGVPAHRWGRYGMWVGSLAKPKGVGTGPDDTLAIVDSGFRTVQLFEADGSVLGAVATHDQPWRGMHPIQVVAGGDGQLLVLDAGASEVWSLTLDEGAIARAREQATLRHLRTPLYDTADREHPPGEAELCLQCHDGLVNDDRYVWDPALGHHPVGVKPERDIPAFFPVEHDGALRCGTCHTPHGTSDLASVEQVETEDDRARLVRHQAPADDLFTRVSRVDAQLCVGCHTSAAHDDVLDRLGLEGSAHPVGRALVRALAKRGTGEPGANLPAGVDGSCLACHTPHGAVSDALGRGISGASCLACHDRSVGGAGNHVLSADGLRASAELPVGTDGATCLTCHAMVEGVGSAMLRRPADGGGLCQACHDDGPARDSAHHGLRGSCSACHDPHEAPGPQLARVAPLELDPGGCRSCHPTTARRGHPVSTAELVCAGCHDSHDPAPTLKSCEECHEEPAQAAQRGGHGTLACADCHLAHRDAPRSSRATNPADGACLHCHGPGGSATVVEAWDHRAPVFGGAGPRWDPLRSLALYREDGTVAEADEGGELACLSCHAVHGPSEGQSDLNLPGWETPCGACHGTDTEARYRNYHHPVKRKEVSP